MYKVASHLIAFYKKSIFFFGILNKLTEKVGPLQFLDNSSEFQDTQTSSALEWKLVSLFSYLTHMDIHT